MRALFRRRRRLPQWLAQLFTAAQTGKQSNEIRALVIESETARKMVVMGFADFIDLVTRANGSDASERE